MGINAGHWRCTCNYENNNLKQSRVFIDSYQNFRVTANQKSTIDTHTNKKNQLKCNKKIFIKPERREQETKGRKKRSKNKSEAINKMAIRTYISIITLNVNGLKAPTKRHRLAE